jgi:hypothetical protein
MAFLKPGVCLILNFRAWPLEEGQKRVVNTKA